MKDMKLKTLALLLPVGMLAACAGTGASYQPKLAAAPNPGYEADLAECRMLAKSEGLMNPETQTKAVIGGIAGGLAGAEDGGQDALAGAVLGAATGTAVGAAETRHERKNILIECLKQRGQPVAG